MKIQSRTSEPRLAVGKELLCFVPMREANDAVVCLAHDNHVTGGASLLPLVEPLIIDMSIPNENMMPGVPKSKSHNFLAQDQCCRW
jgi:hypothetical protein